MLPSPFQIGGALGTAVAATVAAAHTGGGARLIALTEGYQAAFTACAIVAIIGLAVAIALLRQRQAPSPAEPDPSAATYADRAGPPERPRAREYSGA